MSWTKDQLPDLTGRTIIVTGANTGIGFHAAKAFAERGARVVLACRNVAAGQAAAGRIDGTTEVRRIDLASLDSVREFAAGWSDPVDVLVNNAGVIGAFHYQTTSDGYENHFGTNHLGHFVLTGLLLPSLLDGPGGRVVAVASVAHKTGTADVVKGNEPPAYTAKRAYGNSKLANLLFARQLQHEATTRGLPLVVTAAHPGTAATELFTRPEGLGGNRVLRVLLKAAIPITAQSPEAGATSTLFAATEAEPGSYTGPQRRKEGRGPIGPATRSALAQDDLLAAKLWAASEEMTDFHYPWPA